MKSWTYNKEIQTLVEQFAGAFNDILIKRFDKTKTIEEDQFKVKFVYAPKQRVLESLRTPAPGGITVPAIAININGIQRDQTRIFNKTNGFNIDALSISGPNDYFKRNIRQPVPINIGINMSIITKFQTDMDQVLCNFIPYCDPYIIISWVMPVSYNNDYEIRTEILWSGSVNVTYPTDIGANQSYRITADTTFTIKGWLFKSNQYNETLKKIYYINTDYVPVVDEDIMSCDLITDLDEYESYTVNLSARPQLECLRPLTIQKKFAEVYNQEKLIYITGQHLSFTRAVYLSASSDLLFPEPPSLFNPFNGLSSLEPYYPPFSGYSVSSYEIVDNNTLVLSLPFSSIETLGNLDIIIENEAGYGSFIQDTSARYISYSKPLTSGYMTNVDPFDEVEQMIFEQDINTEVIPPSRIYGITVI